MIGACERHTRRIPSTREERSIAPDNGKKNDIENQCENEAGTQALVA